MELLSEAQAYQMGPVLSQIRDRIARHYPATHSSRASTPHLFSRLKRSTSDQKHSKAPRAIFEIPDHYRGIQTDKLDIMPGTSLYELWKYYEGVRACYPCLGPYRI